MKRKKRATKKKKKQVVNETLVFDYYLPIFYLLNKHITDIGLNFNKDPEISRRFWSIVPPGEYEPYRGLEIVNQYANVLEKEIAEFISKHSISYWLHIYRRLSPGPIGREKKPVTIYLVRSTLEAAFQKYGKETICDGIARSDKVSDSVILNGILMEPNFKWILKIIRESPAQLVLTKFGLRELIEFYNIERIAYEIWRSGAILRIMSKGAPLLVDHENSIYTDLRSDELNRLVEIYDERSEIYENSTLTGTVWESALKEGNSSGDYFVPCYNLNKLKLSDLKMFLGSLNFHFPDEHNAEVPNFIWLPYPFRSYMKAHLPFSIKFKEVHGIRFESVVAVLYALFYRVFGIWLNVEHSIWRFMQRAYEGPGLKNDIIDDLKTLIPKACKDLNIENYVIDELNDVIDFLSLNDKKKENIDLILGGPHSIFLPFSNDRFFIDYVWFGRILYTLFLNVNPSDQNFKGEALEDILTPDTEVLTSKPCISYDGNRKQIDAAYGIQDLIVIIECRAVGKSITFDRGDVRSINYRCDLINRSLDDIDDKGSWLKKSPIGRNYDISQFKYLLPIVITPFTEFINSENHFYWIFDRVPRVLVADEFKKLISNEDFYSKAINSRNTIRMNKIKE